MESEIKELEKSLQGVIQRFKDDMGGIRTNRPSPKLVEDIRVDYFDQKMTVKQLGSITIVPPREIDINVWDRNAVSPVIKAVEASALGVGANADGNLIRINLPQLTDERRQEFVKLAKQIAEQARIKIRTCRDDANKKSKTLPEDLKFKSLKKVQELVDTANKDIEVHLVQKIDEINV